MEVNASEQRSLPAVLTINVGGTLFTTLRSTLCKYEDSMLASMFSGRHEVAKDSEGRPFVDADPSYFEHILSFLRREITPIISSDSTSSNALCGNVLTANDAWEVYREALYFGIDPLVEHLQTHPLIFNKLVRQKFDMQYLEYKKARNAIVEVAVRKMCYVQRCAEVVVHFKNNSTLGAKDTEHYEGCDADVVLPPLSTEEKQGRSYLLLINDLRKDGFRVDCRSVYPSRVCSHHTVNFKFWLETDVA